jgi:hypothetical protein
MKEKKVKNFNEHEYNVELNFLEQKKPDVFILRNLFSLFEIIDQDAQNLEALEKMLIKKTGIINPSMAANSINMLKEYNLVCEISQDLNLDNYDDTGELKNCQIKALKEVYTTYYTNDEIIHLNEVQKVVDAMNGIDKVDAQSIHYSNLTSQFVYRIDVANTTRQFSKLR